MWCVLRSLHLTIGLLATGWTKDAYRIVVLSFADILFGLSCARRLFRIIHALLGAS